MFEVEVDNIILLGRILTGLEIYKENFCNGRIVAKKSDLNGTLKLKSQSKSIKMYFPDFVFCIIFSLKKDHIFRLSI